MRRHLVGKNQNSMQASIKQVQEKLLTNKVVSITTSGLKGSRSRLQVKGGEHHGKVWDLQDELNIWSNVSLIKKEEKETKVAEMHTEISVRLYHSDVEFLSLIDQKVVD